MRPDFRTVGPCVTVTLPVNMAMFSCSRTSSLSLSIWIGWSPDSLRPETTRFSLSLCAWTAAGPAITTSNAPARARKRSVDRIGASARLLAGIGRRRNDVHAYPRLENHPLSAIQHFHGAGGYPGAMALDIHRLGGCQPACGDVEEGGAEPGDNAVGGGDDDFAGKTQ